MTNKICNLPVCMAGLAYYRSGDGGQIPVYGTRQSDLGTVCTVGLVHVVLAVDFYSTPRVVEDRDGVVVLVVVLEVHRKTSRGFCIF